MKLTSANLGKADDALRRVLDSAKPNDPVRVVMILDPSATSPRADEADLPKPSQFPDRIAYRQALIAKQKAARAESIGATIESLKDLSLRVRGGEITRAVIVEGAAKDILTCLALPGVRSVALDQPI